MDYLNIDQLLKYSFKQCCGSGSVWIRFIWPDPDPDTDPFQTIRIRVKVYFFVTLRFNHEI